MKKSLLVLLIGVMFFVTGCGSNEEESKTADNSGTLTCTKSETNEDGYNVKDTMVVTYSDKKVIKVEETNIEEMDSDTADMTVSFGQLFATSLNEISGFNVSYEKETDTSVKYKITVDYTTLDLTQLKETFGDDFDESSFYSDTDITIDEFKSNNLVDYTCE